MAKKTKKEEEQEAVDKQNIKTLKQNQKLIKQAYKVKANRHVKEKNEPVFDGFLEHFQTTYAKEVASRSALEILKLVQSDEFHD